MTARKSRLQIVLAVFAALALSVLGGLMGLKPPASYLGVTLVVVVFALIYYFDELPFGHEPFRRR